MANLRVETVVGGPDGKDERKLGPVFPQLTEVQTNGQAVGKLTGSVTDDQTGDGSAGGVAGGSGGNLADHQVLSQALAERADLVIPEDVDYVTNAIRYDFDDRALMGLRRFAALAERAGLIDNGHVNLFGPTYETIPAKADVDGLLLALLDGEEVDVDGLTTLLEHGPVAVLGLAADLKRRETDTSNTVRYVVSDTAPDTIQAADLRDADVRKALMAQSYRGDLACLYVSVGALDTPNDRASLLSLIHI